MTQRFILDENIVILAATSGHCNLLNDAAIHLGRKHSDLAEKGETDRGEPDLSCRTLFTQIIEICHTIVLDPTLWDKYHS